MRVDVELNSIRIRNTQESDLDFVIHSERDPYNSQFVNQWTKEEHKNSLFQEDILHVIVEDTAADRPVGYGIIAGLTSLDRSIELKRIVIVEKGKGFGRETLKAVKKIAFDQLHAHRLWLDVRYKNHRAQNLYKDEGFIEEGVLRECILYDGSYESLIVMSILESEYDKAANT